MVDKKPINIISSYGMEIKGSNRVFLDTVNIYRSAISLCIKIFNNEWNDISAYKSKSRLNYAENLIHSTSKNKAKYPEFDKQFHKMPSYFRRSVTADALGYLSSYHTGLDNWHKNGCSGRKPHLQIKHNKMPVFYRDNAFKTDDFNNDEVYLKLFIHNDWNWVKVRFKHTDLQYIRKHLAGLKMSCPVLEKRNHKWFLRFSFTSEVLFPEEKPLNSRKILAVDLGINTDATCSVMTMDGAIPARRFINFAGDKDCLYHTLNKIKGVSQKSGSHNTTRLWRYAKFHNDGLACKIANAITAYAIEQDVDVIVFEYLDMTGKKRGSRKQKLHMWKKNTIQSIVEHKAHIHGIRINRICAWGTSRLAYDGSGTVLRGKEAGFNTYELCKFNNGKVYNCDLSASYNIGARYFIREIEKSISAKKWSLIQAKVPECAKRTQCTYSTLLNINSVA
jgi:IS605 OrfB family transposase